MGSCVMAGTSDLMHFDRPDRRANLYPGPVLPKRNGEDRAPGMGRAVAAHLAGDGPGWHATAAGTHHQQVSGAEATPATTSLAARFDRPDRRGRRGLLSPEGSVRNAGSNKRRFGNCKRGPGQPKPPA